MILLYYCENGTIKLIFFIDLNIFVLYEVM